MSRMSRLKITAIGSTLGLLVAGGLVAGLAGPAAADAVHHGQHAGHSNHVTRASDSTPHPGWTGEQGKASDSATEASEPSGQDDHGGMAHQELLLKAPMAPSVLNDPKIFGVLAGGLPWVLKSGWVTLHADGQLAVHVGGLIVPAASNPKGTNSNPLPGTAAAVFCNGTMVGSTPTPVSFPSSGSVTIHTMVTLPSTCLAPTVMLLPAKAPGGVLTTDTTMYIAISGRG